MASNGKYRSVVTTLGRPAPGWVTDPDDQLRVAAMDAFTDIYENNASTFLLAWRGEEDKPLYVPSAARIVEATNRYLAKDWRWVISSAGGNEAGATAVQTAVDTLAIREELRAKFYSLKRNLLVRGDGLLHLLMDPTALPGSRISIRELDPRKYFRIPDPTDDSVTLGCYIVDLIIADDGKTQIARRLHYGKDGTGQIFTQLTFWEQAAWDDRFVGHPALKPVPVPEAYNVPSLAPLLEGMTLPPGISQLPVYHFRNRRNGDEPYGRSELAGIETLILGVNQAVSDEDLTLALQGLGVYVTNAAPPLDASGAEGEWVIAPGAVLEIPGGDERYFRRVEGVGSVAAIQEHLSYIGARMDEAAGLSKVAVGNVDVQVAQSGVALRLDMAPILAKNAETETELLSRLDQFMYDLIHMWMPLDGVSVPDDVLATNTFGDPLPVDRAGIVEEVSKLVAAQLMSKEFAVDYLSKKLGYTFPPDMLAQISAEVDQVASRLGAGL